MSIDNGINGSEIDKDELVEQNAAASNQDDSYSFDEENTGDEEFHDSNDEEIGELNFDVDGDRMNEVSQENEQNY